MRIPIAVSLRPYPGLLPNASPIKKNAIVSNISGLIFGFNPWLNNKNHPIIDKTKVKTSISDII